MALWAAGSIYGFTKTVDCWRITCEKKSAVERKDEPCAQGNAMPCNEKPKQTGRPIYFYTWLAYSEQALTSNTNSDRPVFCCFFYCSVEAVNVQSAMANFRSSRRILVTPCHLADSHVFLRCFHWRNAQYFATTHDTSFATSIDAHNVNT
jgi:hypothetical protein